jgi:asparagine synthase (glutamine-hydrolysing)
MPRFCAVLGASDPAGEIVSMGGEPVAAGPRRALGTLAGERPGGAAGPYRAGDLIAVGEVTLHNRAALVADLADGEPPPAATRGDGEVLLRVYARWGLAGIARANGLFALAIWDGASLLLVRDPVGSRTLFYTHAGGCWAAASSLRALRRWPRQPARLNLAAVRSFLTFAYLPGDETLLEGVTELLPGCCLRLTADTGSVAPPLQSYWEPCEGDWDPAAPEAVYAGRLRALLEEAVAARLPAGQPVGLFLSGGLDSSLITALAARQHDQPAHTYSIHFGAHLPNELGYSGLVAAHCRTQHHILGFTGAQVAAHLAETVAYLDCPVGDPLTVPNLLLARAAAANGQRVILNGEGGDPCFGGPKNLPMLAFEFHRADPDPAARARAYLHAYRKAYDELPQLLSPAVQQALRTAPPLERLVQPYLESPRMRSYLHRLLYTNVRTKGAHHILTKVERLTAACGVEGRSPLFDPAVVAYAFAMPPALKLAGTAEKWVLKLVARNLLPATIVDRPKSGMRVPVQAWLRGPLRDLAADLLLGPAARARGLFQPATIQTWLRGEGLLWPRQGTLLWLVLTLELWLRAYLDRADPAVDDLAWRPRRTFSPRRWRAGW